MIVELARPGPAGKLVSMPLCQAGTVFLERLHRGEYCGQVTVNCQVRRFAVRRWRDDNLVNQLPQEVEMSLDVIMLASAGARDCRQRGDGGGVHGWIDDEDFWRPIALSGRSCEMGFNLLTLFLEIVEHFVERFDLRLAIQDALGDLVCDDILLV
ncbi:hypothetical protein [Rhizobium anhuiense]|uniref:hypothetical protein n=1 Tax=Rhizobium anhuiense TaxID=1184720 RepID=UPI0007B505A3|nr:hypothetical protein [Rhizobium anhuiense]KZS56956.1 hypothetical protein AS890_06985 [Rhizobium anhuiense bv. trifolii]